jgi:hypothetical protein
LSQAEISDDGSAFAEQGILQRYIQMANSLAMDVQDPKGQVREVLKRPVCL